MSQFKIVDQLFLQTYNELYGTSHENLSDLPEQSYPSEELKLIADNYYYRLLPDKVIRNERLTRQVKRLKVTVKVLFVIALILGYLLFKIN